MWVSQSQRDWVARSECIKGLRGMAMFWSCILWLAQSEVVSSLWKVLALASYFGLDTVTILLPPITDRLPNQLFRFCSGSAFGCDTNYPQLNDVLMWQKTWPFKRTIHQQLATIFLVTLPENSYEVILLSKDNLRRWKPRRSRWKKKCIKDRWISLMDALEMLPSFGNPAERLEARLELTRPVPRATARWPYQAPVKGCRCDVDLKLILSY